jgi:hypothetical protein
MSKSYLVHIKVKEQLDTSWETRLESVIIMPDSNSNTTILSGLVRDQAALRSLLNRLFSLGLTLVALESIESFQA